MQRTQGNSLDANLSKVQPPFAIWRADNTACHLVEAPLIINQQKQEKSYSSR